MSTNPLIHKDAHELNHNRKRLPVKDIFNAYYITQAKSQDFQWTLFFFSVFSHFLQIIAFVAIFYRVAKDEDKVEQR